MTQQKAIIFDASTLISLAMNGLLSTLEELKKVFNGSFLITPDVKKEVIDKPLTITRFKLEALRVKHLLDKGVLELSNEKGIQKRTQDILDMANSSFEGKGKDIKLVSAGEISCLALSEILSKKKILNVVAIDERTTRMFVESPDKLKDFLERKMHIKITSGTAPPGVPPKGTRTSSRPQNTSLRGNNFEIFKNFKIIRSAELVYIAHKKKLVKIGNGQLLDALLWAVKFKGCSISNEEIKEIKS